MRNTVGVCMGGEGGMEAQDGLELNSGWGLLGGLEGMGIIWGSGGGGGGRGEVTWGHEVIYLLQ